MAGGRVGEVLDGEDGDEVGDVGRVWGEKVIDCVGGGSRVVDVVIWTISVSILPSQHLSYRHHTARTTYPLDHPPSFPTKHLTPLDPSLPTPQHTL